MDELEIDTTHKGDGMNEQKELRVPALVDQEWGQVLSLVPVDLEATARAEKAFQRRREVRSADDLLRLVLAYSLCDWSLRLIGVWASLIGLGRLSDVAVLKRLRHSQRWLGKLIGAWMEKRRVMFPQRAVRLRLVDATIISQPGSSGIDWRVHLSLDLGQMCLDGVELTDVKGGETLVRHPAQPGDILVADRGYAHRRGLGSVLSEGAQAVVRINWQNLPVQELTGESLDIVAWLRQIPQDEPSEKKVLVDTPQGSFEIRLIACHLSEQATNAARRHIRKEARKKGRTPDQRTLDAAGFIILVTSLPQEQWSTEQVLELYRIRWQIELQIKRLKSLLHIDQLRAQDPALAQVYLLGKLLVAFLTDELTGQIAALYPDWFQSVDRPVSPWRLLILLSDALRNAIRGMITLTKILVALPDLGRYLRDAPRKRRQQLACARALLLSLTGTYLPTSSLSLA